MKKIFTKLMLLAVAAAALVSCENNYDESTPVVELTQTVTLSADKTAVRTELIEGVPYWSKGDAVGVYLEDETKHYKFTNDAEEATPTTSFTGQTAVANTLFVYYPYTANGVADKGAKVDIPVNQEPTATSFDGKADIMLAKPVTLDEEGMQVGNLEFARLGAIVKVVLNDNTKSLAEEHLSTLTMTAESNLVGRVYIDVKNQELGELYYGGSKSVTATYTEPIAANNPVYFVVYPQTLAAGSKLTIEAATEGYAISRSRELGKDFVLEAGKVYDLTVNLEAEDVIKEETGLALPFKDDFARVAYDASEGGIDLSVLGENYSAMEKVYKAKIGEGGILKLGTSSAEGYFTTTALNLSKPFTVFVEAQRYGTSTSDKLQITVGSQVLTSTNLTADSKYYVFEFEAASKKEQVEIRTVKRAYINDLQIVEGHGLDVPTLPAVLTVSTAEISGVSYEGEAKTFTYSVANPVEGTSVVITDDAEWLTTADNNGTVTVTVEENTLEEVRNATITVKYGDLTKTVTVNQNAKPAEGGETGGTVVDVLNYAFTGISGSSYTDWSGKTGTSGAVYAGNSYANNSISYIQLRTTNSNSGIVTTTSGGKVRSITITWASNTGDGKTLDVYGKNSSYSRAADLFSSAASTKGTKIGTLTKGQSNTLTITGDYEYIGMRSTSGAIYITQLEITWESGEGGGSTPEPEPATPVWGTVTAPAEVAAAGGSASISYSVTDAVEGKFASATTTATWITGFTYTADKVTFNVAANTGAAREATVTLSYEGITETKNVTVKQAAGNTGGGESAQPVTESLNIYANKGTMNGTASISWEGTNFTVTNEKGSSTTAIRTSDSDHYRIYVGSILKFTAKNNKKITKLVITCTSAGNYATYVKNALGDNATISGATVTWTGSATEVISNKIGTQTRINKVEATLE